MNKRQDRQNSGAMEQLEKSRKRKETAGYKRPS